VLQPDLRQHGATHEDEAPGNSAHQRHYPQRGEESPMTEYLETILLVIGLYGGYLALIVATLNSIEWDD